jgi:hypothetical protein
MKPTLDKMTDSVIASLSGDAKEFYDREFGFFSEVTSISGKLKPFIKKSKPEKKVTEITYSQSSDPESGVIRRPRLMKRWPR